MSFFLTKQQKAKRAPKGARSAPIPTKQNATILNAVGCAACPLNKAQIDTPKMEPTLAKHTSVYFLAEAPGRHEDEDSHQPLTGPSGKLLRSCIPDDYDECAFDNIVNCRPPQNRTPVWTEIECCRPRRVKWIEQAKPKLIVGLGLVPLQAMLHSTDMAGMRGRIFAVKVGNHACWFMPTYHPSFILRIAYDKKKPLNSKMGHCFRMDISKALELADKLPPPEIDTIANIKAGLITLTGHEPNALTKALGLLAKAQQAKHKAVDIENYPLHPYSGDAKMLTFAFSFDNTHFAMALDHPKAGWSPNDRQKILAKLKAVLADDTVKIAHNAPHEIGWFVHYFGRRIADHRSWECTQMQAHHIDERKGKQAFGSDEESRRATYQALDFLYKQYFGLAYKSHFKLDKKHMDKADLSETLIYNAVDSRATLKLWHHQHNILEKANLLKPYSISIRSQTTVALMQDIGIGIDQKEVKIAQGTLEKEIDTIRKEIDALKVVKAFKADRKEFNPLSNQDALAIFKDYLKSPEIKPEIKRDREGNERKSYSLAKGILEEIEHPLASLIVQLRNRNKLKSTYVDPFELGKGEFIYPDGLIHTNFNTTFTETTRTSSDEPNHQNWPKRNDSWVRKQVVAGKGKVILSFDYGQLQACTAAMCSKDKVFVKALWEDYDTHMEWAIKLDKLAPQLTMQHGCDMSDKALAKKYRSIVKNKLVFPAIFGAQNSSLAEYLNCDEYIINKLMKEFWSVFSGLHDWQNRLMKTYWEYGYVESPLGHLHRYPITRNQAINFPVQAAEAEIVSYAMNKLSEHAVSTGEWHLHPVWNIHDDLSYIVPDDDKVIEDSINFIYRQMLDLPFKWINVPLSVECSIGNNWYDMKDIGKFWSHKDL